MNRKELTKTIMIIANRNKPFGLHDLYENIPALKGLIDWWEWNYRNKTMVDLGALKVASSVKRYSRIFMTASWVYAWF